MSRKNSPKNFEQHLTVGSPMGYDNKRLSLREMLVKYDRDTAIAPWWRRRQVPGKGR
ncbi:MAG: hypothetical protein GDA48_07365 [Hormoscilla sp. GM102CHS1]|nr:hypothetical protein [Hormoscilla sp. GM102CHS1]